MRMMLEVAGLDAFYGQNQALYGVGFSLDEGQIRTLLGANGAGKTTVLRALCGMVRTGGDIRFDGKRISGWATEDIVRLGVAHVPEGRGTFVRTDGRGELAARRDDPPRPRARSPPISSASTSISRASRSGARSRPERCPAASSRCWRSAAR